MCQAFIMGPGECRDLPSLSLKQAWFRFLLALMWRAHFKCSGAVKYTAASQLQRPGFNLEFRLLSHVFRLLFCMFSLHRFHLNVHLRYECVRGVLESHPGFISLSNPVGGKGFGSTMTLTRSDGWQVAFQMKLTIFPNKGIVLQKKTPKNVLYYLIFFSLVPDTLRKISCLLHLKPTTMIKGFESR